MRVFQGQSRSVAASGGGQEHALLGAREVEGAARVGRCQQHVTARSGRRQHDGSVFHKQPKFIAGLQRFKRNKHFIYVLHLS